MGVISGASPNSFISAEFVYSKIKREFNSFTSVNLIDDMDFPAYTMEVLRQLGRGAAKETDAICIIQNGQAKLPEDFQSYEAAYRCSNFGITRTPNKLIQNKMIFENDITCETLCRTNNCQIDCHADDKIFNRITVRQYVNEDLVTYDYGNLGLLNLTPNVRQRSNQNSRSLQQYRGNDITINDGYIFTNFVDDAIFLQYYGYPYDENGLPMIMDNIHVEKAVEYYIKYQILLNFWLVDDVANVLNKWQKTEELYKEALAAAKYDLKLPSFSTLVNFVRNKRSINAVNYFSQMDRNR